MTSSSIGELSRSLASTEMRARPSSDSNACPEQPRHPSWSAAFFPARDYNLRATLNSGQTFSWTYRDGEWTGVLQGRWVALRQEEAGIAATAPSSSVSWDWLREYLQIHVNFAQVLSSFPDDAPLQNSIRRHCGLRLVRQDPWECLGSFILSSTKQIVQIRRVVRALCEQLGMPVQVPNGYPQLYAFPTPHAIAEASDSILRSCGMGFRARYLREAAVRVASGAFDPRTLRTMPLGEARASLLQLPGVGPKIADCVLLFSADQPAAFPIDVWVARSLRQHFFGGRPTPVARLQDFAASHFGPWAGYAQQYLFHDARQSAPSQSRAHEAS